VAGGPWWPNSGMVFGTYFLVPFGFAISILLLQAGLWSRTGYLQIAGLLTPIGLALLTQGGQRDADIYRGFLNIFSTRVGGSPLYLTLLATAMFYLYAGLRRVPFSIDMLTGTLVMLGFIGPGSNMIYERAPLSPEPLLAAAILQSMLGLWRRQ